MPAPILAFAIVCSLACRAAAVSSAGNASFPCERVGRHSCHIDLSNCASTSGTSLLRASAYKSRTRIIEESETVDVGGALSVALGTSPDNQASPPTTVKVSGTLSVTLDGSPAPLTPVGATEPLTPVGAAEASPVKHGALREAPTPAPMPEHGYFQALRHSNQATRSVVLPTPAFRPELSRRAGEPRLPWERPPASLLALAAVMVAAASATAVAAVVAVVAVQRVKAVEQLQAAPPLPDHIPGLPGEAYSLSEQEAKIKSTTGSPHSDYRWEELNEPEAEWDTDCGAASSNSHCCNCNFDQNT